MQYYIYTQSCILYCCITTDTASHTVTYYPFQIPKMSMQERCVQAPGLSRYAEASWRSLAIG